MNGEEPDEEELIAARKSPSETLTDLIEIE